MSTKRNIIPNSVHTPDGLEFFVANQQTGECAEISIKAFATGNGKTTFAEGQDSVILGIFFRNPVTENDLVHQVLFVQHCKKLIFSGPLVPTLSTPEHVSILDLTYEVYETHQLIQDEKKTTLGLFIEFINTSHNVNGALVVRLNVSMGHTFIPKTLGAKRYKDTVFFPYDIDPTQYGLRVNPQTIPQRTPLWFKLRGAVSGSKAYTLLGYWVPTKAKDPHWSFEGGGASFNDTQKANMRFGSQSEDYAALLYMMKFPQTRLEMVGWCNAPAPRFPADWGASPDGLIVDPTLTWKDMPACFNASSGMLPTRGALEIKSSKTSLKMDAYYLPQVYMEMICLQTMWCDLVRYKRSSSTDASTHQWSYEHKARVYRIYRDKETEEQLVSLLRYALERKERLQDVVQEPQFVAMRSFLADLAEKLEYIEITPTPDMMIVLKAYDSHKYNAGTVHVPLPPVEKLKDAQRPTKKRKTSKWLAEAQRNHSDMEALFANSDTEQLLIKIGQQMNVYSKVLGEIK
jgi:hypothetical protein